MIGVICDTVVVYVNAAVDYGYIFVFIYGQSYCLVNNLSCFYCISCSFEGTRNSFVSQSLYCQFCNCTNLSISCIDDDSCCIDCQCVVILFTFGARDCNNQFVVIIALFDCVSSVRRNCTGFQFKTGACFDFKLLTFNEVACCCFDLQIFFQLCCFFFSNFCYLLQCSLDACILNCCICQSICGQIQIIGINCYCSLCACACLCQNRVQSNFDDVIFFQNAQYCYFDFIIVVDFNTTNFEFRSCAVIINQCEAKAICYICFFNCTSC